MEKAEREAYRWHGNHPPFSQTFVAHDSHSSPSAGKKCFMSYISMNSSLVKFTVSRSVKPDLQRTEYNRHTSTYLYFPFPPFQSLDIKLYQFHSLTTSAHTSSHILPIFSK